MRTKKYLNDLDVRESEQVFRRAKECTLYNIPNNFFTTRQENINIAITKQ